MLSLVQTIQRLMIQLAIHKLSGGIEENHRNLSQDSQSLGPPNYGTAVVSVKAVLLEMGSECNVSPLS